MNRPCWLNSLPYHFHLHHHPRSRDCYVWIMSDLIWYFKKKTQIKQSVFPYFNRSSAERILGCLIGYLSGVFWHCIFSRGAGSLNLIRRDLLSGPPIAMNLKSYKRQIRIPQAVSDVSFNQITSFLVLDFESPSLACASFHGRTMSSVQWRARCLLYANFLQNRV